MIHEIQQPFPVETPRGRGYARFIIDYGPEEHLFWVVVGDADGEIWVVPNPRVRAQRNWTLGRHHTSPIAGDPPPAGDCGGV